MTPRADVVGSLLRPEALRLARQGAREGRVTPEALRAAEDRAVREAIALQEGAGLDVITDGELRRSSWVITIPLREDAAGRPPLGGFEFLPADPGWWSLWKEPDGRRAQVWTNPTRPFITRPIEVTRDVVSDEYAFLKANARARSKFTIPSPSWHRIFWHPEYSRAAYPTPEDFLRAIAGYLREHVFEGVRGVTRAIHICRGNAPGGRWLANGGYERIAAEVFPRLTRYDRLLLEYDTPRAGDFGPLRHVRPEATVVLGLLTTKQGELEDAALVERRIREAARQVPLERLALSPQCGFASGEAGNPLTPSQQEAKLRRVGTIARRVWPGG